MVYLFSKWKLSNTGGLMFKGGSSVPDRKKVECKQSWPIRQVCSCVQCAIQKKLVYCGALPYLAHVGLCGAETCPPPTQGTRPPPHPGHPPTPSQATHSGYLQLPRSMNMKVYSIFASGLIRTCGYRTVYVNIVLYFSSSSIVFWNTHPPRWFVCIALTVVILRFNI